MVNKNIKNDLVFRLVNRIMDLSLRDALGGDGVPVGAHAEALLKRDLGYNNKVGETVSKSDNQPSLDGKDTSSGELSQ